MAKRKQTQVDTPVRSPRGSILVVTGQAEGTALGAEAVQALNEAGHVVGGASTGRDALRLARSGNFDLLVADCRPADMSAAEFLDRIRQIDAGLPVIVLTKNGDIDAAVACLRDGAYDYLTRPIHTQSLVTTVRQALERRRLRDDIRNLSRQAHGRESFGDLIGRSAAMQVIFRRIAKIAPHHTNVLILGESGTGKEMVAREIHRRSPMNTGPFVAVNCGGVPGDLIESELFGHERGAFTGATQARDGLFVAATGGTLFLDEIGAMPMLQQASLLRSLERKEIRRIGGTTMIAVEVRVIAATNTDLEQAMESGAFRQDLYYRLSSMVINLPTLKERVDDIPLLCAHFLACYAREHRRPSRRFSPQALNLLCARRWPGNVRELQHIVQQSCLFAGDEVIRPADLPFHVGGYEEDRPQTLRDVERGHIRTVLARTAGNKLKAARILGIPRPTLYHRMRKLGLDADPDTPARKPRSRK